MSYLDTAVKVLEGVSYICSVALLVVAILGLRQFNLSKKTLSLNSKRDALKVTIEQITIFFVSILKEFEDSPVDRAGVELVKGTSLTKENRIDWEKIKKDKTKPKVSKMSDKEKYTDLLREAFSPKRVAFNQIEAFSSTFTSGLGDEKTAYLALGKAYCSMIEDYVNALKLFNSDGYYKNTITLYTLWNLRLKKEIIESKMKAIDSTLSETEELTKKHRDSLKELMVEINKIEDSEITSIGVEA